MSQAINDEKINSTDPAIVSTQLRQDTNWDENSVSIKEMYQEWQSLGLAYDALHKVFEHIDNDDVPRHEHWFKLQDEICNTAANDFTEIVMKMLVGTFVDDSLPDSSNFVVEHIIFAARKDAIRLLMKCGSFPSPATFTEPEMGDVRKANEQWALRTATHKSAEARKTNCEVQQETQTSVKPLEMAKILVSMFDRSLSPEAQKYAFERIAEITSDHLFVDAETGIKQTSADKNLMQDHFRLGQMIAATETLFHNFDDADLNEKQADCLYQMQSIVSACNEKAAELYDRLGILESERISRNRSAA